MSLFANIIFRVNIFLDYLLPTSNYVFKRIFDDLNNLYDIWAIFLKAVIPNLHNNSIGGVCTRKNKEKWDQNNIEIENKKT